MSNKYVIHCQQHGQPAITVGLLDEDERDRMLLLMENHPEWEVTGWDRLVYPDELDFRTYADMVK